MVIVKGIGIWNIRFEYWDFIRGFGEVLSYVIYGYDFGFFNVGEDLKILEFLSISRIVIIYNWCNWLEN